MRSINWGPPAADDAALGVSASGETDSQSSHFIINFDLLTTIENVKDSISSAPGR